MHDRLIQYINSQRTQPLEPHEIEIVKATFVPKKLRKHQYLLEQGEVCNIAGFIVKGALKQYTVDESGKENILSLFIENWWAGDRESFVNNTPSPYFIDAFEETDLLVISKGEKLERLIEQQFIKELFNALNERQSLRLLKRVHAAKTFTAEQRLTDLEKTYPEFLQRFPQHIIASYLGMTKETLSRIRANGQNK